MRSLITKHILVIDHETHVREVVQACLKDLGGWEVLEASSAQEGLLIVLAVQVDAIVLDLMLPERNGLSFLQQIRTNPITKTIPVVLLTAQTYLIEPTQFSQLGVVKAIAKPFNPVTLSDQIATSLQWN